MKTPLLLFAGAMMLTSLAFISCNSDATDEILVPEELSETRTEEQAPTYYWDGRSEVPIKLTDDKSYVVFHEKDKQTILDALAKREVKVAEEQVHANAGISSNKFVNPYKAALFYEDIAWAEVDANYQTVLEVPEVIYAYPYISKQWGQSWVGPFRLPNFFYVSTSSVTSLMEMTEKYNVEILGQLKGQSTDVYVVWCTRDSKADAITVANAFHESGKFMSVSIEFGHIVMA